MKDCVECISLGYLAKHLPIVTMKYKSNGVMEGILCMVVQQCVISYERPCVFTASWNAKFQVPITNIKGARELVFCMLKAHDTLQLWEYKCCIKWNGSH